MNFLRRWFRREVPPEYKPLIQKWKALRAAPRNISLDKAEIIVVDIETTGLEPLRDKLVSVGAVPFRRGRLLLGNSFHGVLRQMYRGNRENILLHGIRPVDQARGEPPAQLLVEFLALVGKQPIVAFHAPFDRHFLRRAYRDFLGVNFANPFLDLAWLLPALFPQGEKNFPGLDAWLEHFHLTVHSRHSAAEDALVTAELFLIAMDEARRRGITTVHELFATAKRQAQVHPSASLKRS